MSSKSSWDRFFETTRTFIKHYYKHGIWVVVVSGVVLCLAVIYGRQVEWRNWGKDFRLDPGPSTYKEARISPEFSNKPLVWAVEYLKQLAPEVNIVLHHDLTDGTIKTKNFSVFLRDATLEDVLEAYCANAATNVKLKWQKKGKNILIEPATPTAT